MQCGLCASPAVQENPSLCAVHLCEQVEATVRNTLQEFDMIKPGERVVVAASGGKDSLTLLDILRTSGIKLEVVAVDEGIEGYREKTLQELQAYCAKWQLPLQIKSFEESFGCRLDDMEHQGKPHCSTCGVFRRKLMQEGANKADVLATGHNLDDCAQTIVLNIVLGHKTEWWRTGPIVDLPGLARRIKPLYFVPEKQIRLYAHLKGLCHEFIECPHSYESFRGQVRDALNDQEHGFPGTKQRLVRWYVDKWRQTRINGVIRQICQTCGGLSSSAVCRSCHLKAIVSVKTTQYMFDIDLNL